MKAGVKSAAFTLVELLVVISIIGLLAALVIPLSGIATSKMRIARTKAELNNLVTAIENYKLQTGEYPPDNGNLKTASLATPTDESNYKTYAAMNPLVYELSGAIFTNKPAPSYRPLGRDGKLVVNDLTKAFSVSGLRNAARSRSEIEFKAFSLKPSETAMITNTPVEVLQAPVPGFFSLKGVRGPVYPWFYDASSTNRHNRNGFDLWAEMKNGKETNIIGNWKE